MNYKIAVKVGADDAGQDEYQICEMQVVAKQIEAVAKQSHDYARDTQDLQARGVTTKRDMQIISASYAAARLINGRARRDGKYENLLAEPAKHKLTRNRELRAEMRVEALEHVKAWLVREEGAVFKGSPEGVIETTAFDVFNPTPDETTEPA